MRLRIHPRLFLMLPLLAMASSRGTNITVAARIGGKRSFVRDVVEQPIKHLVNAGTRKRIEQTLYSNLTLAKNAIAVGGSVSLIPELSQLDAALADTDTCAVAKHRHRHWHWDLHWNRHRHWHRHFYETL
uniref:Uncharacterized protein n=1 Tax=Globodera rostochiensis TaxID=31243 RepID=A0A914GU90_GLORO